MIVAITAFILIIIEGCVGLASMPKSASPTNSAACGIFASAYNSLILDSNTQDYASFAKDEKVLHDQMGVAFTKADGGVATSLDSAITQSAPYLINGDSSNQSVLLFNTAMNNVVQACQTAGVNLSIDKWGGS